MDPRKRAADAYGAFSNPPNKNASGNGNAKKGKKTSRNKRHEKSGPASAGGAESAGGSERTAGPASAGGPKDSGTQKAEDRVSGAAQGPGAEFVPLNPGSGISGNTAGRESSPSSGFFRNGFGPKKAAKLLLLLGKEQAAKVLRHLNRDEIEEITAEIAKISRIEKTEARKILEEFGQISRGVRETRGGKDIARQILVNSVGEEKGNAILRKVSPDKDDRPFAFLEDLDNQQIMMLIRKEPSHVVSIILAYLQPKQSSEVLESFPPDKQKEIVKRLAKMERIAPEVLNSIEEKLKQRLRTQGKVVTEEIEGERVLAEILKNMNVSDEERILENLESQNTDLAESVRERLFTVDAIPEIPDYDLQKVLRDFEDRELAILLKGKPQEVEEKVMRNLSSRRQELVSYERQYLGRMKRSEVEETTGEFLRYLREMAERGEISLHEDEYI
jgi:flagellar motor switch protein FliG